MSDRRSQYARDDRRRDRDGGGAERDKRARSRSPHYRGARRGDYDADAYSSSRGYREREREERYGGGGGRRDWDRDRDRGSARRDARRDDVDGRRRDNRRDLFEDRRRPRDDDRRGGGAGGDRERDMARDRDDMRQLDRQQRHKSNSPPRKPREPTPDLTDVVPITERKRRLNQWDIKPSGYENISAEQAKMSGMFPLPGAPRQQPIDASRLQAFMNQPGNSADQSALKPSTARQAKRLFVYQLPHGADEKTIVDFFNLQLNGLNVTRGMDPCVSALVNSEQGYAAVEFKTAEDATHALAFDGAKLEASHASNGSANGDSQGLSIKRPRDYIMSTVRDETKSDVGGISQTVAETQNKICVSNVPIYLDDAQVKELILTFGELRSFVLLKDTSSGQSRGIAFCEYLDADAVTDVAVEALNGMELGDSHLKVRRASVGIQQLSNEMSTSAMRMQASATNPDVSTGRVLCLFNMITQQELMDEDEVEDIKEDVQEQCSKYGQVLAIKIPRHAGARANAGSGKIYVKFDSNEAATQALGELSGRQFSGRTVVVSYFSEESFDVDAW